MKLMHTIRIVSSKSSNDYHTLHEIVISIKIVKPCNIIFSQFIYIVLNNDYHILC